MANVCAGRRFAGQSAVEFSLSALILTMLIFGVLDFGRGVLQHQDLTNAVREGARYAATDSSARAQSTSTFVALVADAAAQRSPSLRLSATNFQSAGGGSIACETAPSSARPQQSPFGFVVPNQLAGDGLLALGQVVLAKQATSTPVPTATPTTAPSTAPTATPTTGLTPTSTSISSGSSVTWTTETCSAAQPGDRLTVCAQYAFTPIADKLFRIGTIQMHECTFVTIQ